MMADWPIVKFWLCVLCHLTLVGLVNHCQHRGGINKPKANGLHENKCKKHLELAGTINGIEQSKKRMPNFTIDDYAAAHLGIISISLINCRIKGIVLPLILFFLLLIIYSTNRLFFTLIQVFRQLDGLFHYFILKADVIFQLLLV